MTCSVIFDTDMGNDVDDALALGMLHALQTRGHGQLRAVTLTKRHPLAPPYVAMLNRFYGRAEIPIGMTELTRGPEDANFLTLAAQQPPPPLESALTLLRRVLASAADQSVVIIQVGFSTNLAALLDSTSDAHSPLSGHALIAQKVSLLSLMGGAFAPIAGDAQYREFNIIHDIPAARTLVERWPTPIVFSGFEVGLALPYPAPSILSDFNYVPNHPLAMSYQSFLPTPHERPCWDLTSVLYALLPDRDYFGLSPAGQVRFDAQGVTQFTAQAQGSHRYLILNAAQTLRTCEALTQLTSQPPPTITASLPELVTPRP